MRNYGQGCIGTYFTENVGREFASECCGMLAMLYIFIEMCFYKTFQKRLSDKWNGNAPNM